MPYVCTPYGPGVLVHENLEIVEATLLLVPDDAVRHVDFHKLKNIGVLKDFKTVISCSNDQNR